MPICCSSRLARVGLRPEVVAFRAEILEPEPRGLGIRDEPRAPVVEDLQPAQPDVRLLDVDPVVGGYAPAPHRCADRGLARDQADDDEVAVREPAGDLAHVRRGRGVHALDEVLHRHRRYRVVAAHRLDRVRVADAHVDGDDPAAREPDALDAAVRRDRAAALAHLPGDFLPQLSGTELRIEEALDQARVRGLRREAHRATHRVNDGARERQPLDALRAPRRADPGAGDAPDLLGVRLEERLVELPPEPVDEEVLEVAFGTTRERLGGEIAQSRAHRSEHAQVDDRADVEPDRVVEEAPAMVDPRQSVPHQHHPVGIREFACTCRGEVQVAVSRPVGEPDALAFARRGRVDRQDLLPPVHHPVRAREETMPAEVHAEAAVVHGSGEPAHRVARLDDEWRDVAVSQKLERRGEARGARADDDRAGRGGCHGSPERRAVYRRRRAPLREDRRFEPGAGEWRAPGGSVSLARRTSSPLPPTA